MSKFSEVAAEIGALVTEKNQCYGDSFAKCGDFLRLLWPNGIAPEQYGDALAMVRIFDKQMRIATAKDALGESPYRDIAGYGILGAVKDAAAHKAPSLCDSEVLDFSLPSIILEGSRADVLKKHAEEEKEWESAVDGSDHQIIEAWDCLQAKQTYAERGGCGCDINDQAVFALDKYHKEGRPVMSAKAGMLYKNARRGYYAPEVCKIILESNGERWRRTGGGYGGGGGSANGTYTYSQCVL